VACGHQHPRCVSGEPTQNLEVDAKHGGKPLSPSKLHLLPLAKKLDPVLGKHEHIIALRGDGKVHGPQYRVGGATAKDAQTASDS